MFGLVERYDTLGGAGRSQRCGQSGHGNAVTETSELKGGLEQLSYLSLQNFNAATLSLHVNEYLIFLRLLAFILSLLTPYTV